VVDEPAIGIGFAVDVIDGIQGVLETFIDSNPVALSFVCLVVRYQRAVHFRFLVDICEFVFP
jgi:hypothetical protein